MKTGLIRILLVEDHPGDARLLREALAEANDDAVELKHVVRLADALANLEDGTVDIVLLDLSLPDATGMGTVQKVRQAAPEAPIVILTGMKDEAFALRAVREGAQDYLVKGQIDGPLLIRSVRYAIERQRWRTERMRAAKALQASQEYALNLINSSLDMIIATDLQGQIVEFNPAAQVTFGYSFDEILGQPMHRLFAEAQDWTQIQDTVFERGRWVAEARQVRKSGEVFPCYVSASVIHNHQGGLEGTMSISRDVSQKASLEQQLRQAQKMEAIGRLAGGIAHDFNNLLTIAQGHAALLMSEPGLGESALDSVRQILNATERGANLTKQLLAFSRKTVLNPEPIDLNDLIAQMSQMLHRVLGEDILIRVKASEDPAVTTADAGMVQLALLNLAVNARDAMPNGGELIMETETLVLTPEDIEGEAEASEGSYVRLSVRDTGCGIPAEHLPRIFDPFFTTKQVGKGTGLGLATAYGIVKQHEGWITVESQVGHGSVFHILLPQCKLEPASRTAASPEPQMPRGSETVLLVEDELQVRMLVASVLTRLGYQVMEAGSAPDALELWQACAGRVDLLLTDFVLPGGMTGQELANRLRAEQPSLRVILASGHSETLSGTSLTHEPYFLQKPFPPDELAKMVRHCLDNR